MFKIFWLVYVRVVSHNGDEGNLLPISLDRSRLLTVDQSSQLTL